MTRSHNRVEGKQGVPASVYPVAGAVGSVEPRSQAWSEAVRTARVHYERAEQFMPETICVSCAA